MNNQHITEEIKKEIKICTETNENENTTTPKLWDFVKAVLRARFIATQALNDTMDQLDLIDIYRIFHPKTMNFTFFSSAHGTFSRIDHILGHKSSLSKFEKTEIISNIFSDHNAVRLDANYREKNLKIQTYGG